MQVVIVGMLISDLLIALPSDLANDDAVLGCAVKGAVC
jgi:hypothetical protein